MRRRRRLVGGGVASSGGAQGVVFSVTLSREIEGGRAEENRSRFAAFGGPCPDESSIAPLVASLISAHRLGKATQVSWAARYADHDGRLAEVKHDGGEAGAGRAILEVMQARGAGNCLVLVARWFGGRHLGGLRFRIYRALTEKLLPPRD
jgi:putative IMPACT (imprinted ancient) family translation regulator